MGWGNINRDNVKGNCVNGVEDGKSWDFSKLFLPCPGKLALEGIYGRGDYNRSGEPFPILCDSYSKGRLSSKVPLTRTLQNFE